MLLNSRETCRDCALLRFADSVASIYCYTFRELLMLAWIEELTDIPDWQAKIFDPEYVFRWKSAKLITGHDVTRSMVDWVNLANNCKMIALTR